MGTANESDAVLSLKQLTKLEEKTKQSDYKAPTRFFFTSKDGICTRAATPTARTTLKSSESAPAWEGYSAAEYSLIGLCLLSHFARYMALKSLDIL